MLGRLLFASFLIIYGIGHYIWWNNNATIGKKKETFLTLTDSPYFPLPTVSQGFFTVPLHPLISHHLLQAVWRWELILDPQLVQRQLLGHVRLVRLTVFRNKDWTNSKKKSACFDFNCIVKARNLVKINT